MATLQGIEYDEMYDGSGVAELSDKPTAKRVLRCAWGDVSYLARALKGYTTIVDGSLVIYPATPHPTYIDLFPKTISVKPSGRVLGENTWTHGVLTVNYELPEESDPSSPDPADLYSERLRAAYEVLTIPGKSTESEGGVSKNADITITIPNISYDLTIHRVPVLPFPKIISFLGVDGMPKVNSATFKGAAPGHMLFLSADADRETTSFGVEDWSVTYHFLWSPVDHRKKFNPDTGAFEDVTFKASGDPIYAEGDFNTLFY